MRKLISKSPVLLTLFLIAHAFAEEPPETVESFLAGHHLKDTPPEMRAALSSSDPEVRGFAAGSLAEKKDLKSIPLLKAALAREPMPNIQLTIAGALDQLRDSAGHIWLVNVCKQAGVQSPYHVQAAYRMEAAYRVLEDGSDDCLSPVIDMLGSKPDPETTSIGVLYLRNSKTPPAGSLIALRKKLEATLRDSSREERWHASRILAVIGDSSAIDPMRMAIQKETDAGARHLLENDLQTLKARLHTPS